MPTEAQKVLKIDKKLKLVIGGGVLIFILLLILFLIALLPKTPSKKVVFPTPTPNPTPPQEQIVYPSAYATDSAVLKIEEELKSLENQLQITDIKETGLNPPVLDMKVNLKEP